MTLSSAYHIQALRSSPAKKYKARNTSEEAPGLAIREDHINLLKSYAWGTIARLAAISSSVGI